MAIIPKTQSLYRYQAMNKRKNPFADKLFGAATTANPLNCKKCGSKKLQYVKGSHPNEIKANCNDCGFGFEVARAIAPYINHLAERANSVDSLPLFSFGGGVS